MDKGTEAVLAHGGGQPSNSRGGALKQDRAIRSREQILTAAAEAFAASGYSSVTIADVAQRARMTKGAVYFHFANKEALAVAVSEAFYRRWRLLHQEVAALRLAPFDALAEFLRRTGRLFHDDRVTQAGARLQIEHELLGTQILPKPFATYHGLVLELLEEAHAQGALRPGADPQALARLVTGSAFGAQHLSWVVGNWADVNERMDEVVALLLEPWRARED